MEESGFPLVRSDPRSGKTVNKYSRKKVEKRSKEVLTRADKRI
jgi:hypothetical protein